ncbi:MAG: glycosyltransferase [Myxococcales bacterium]|nr:glycosyltransferase [Myxococcales bacterium]
MEAIRLLLFTTSLGIGGTEGQFAELALRLDPRRFRVSITSFRLAGPHFARLAARGIPMTELPVRRLWGAHTLWQQLAFARALRAERIDLVHATGFYPNVFALPVTRATGVRALGSVREHAGHWRAMQRRANWLALSLADAVVVNAETTRREVCDAGLAPGAVRLIHNGLDVERFACAVPRAELRSELGWPADAPVVAVVSRVAPAKGIDVFLAAAVRLASARPDVRFLVIGDSGLVRAGADVMGGYRAELERRAAELGLGGRIRFLGQRSDVPELLAAVDIAVQPSLSEALSNSLLESMASGTPVVATRVGDHAAVVDDGVTGLLCPPGDAGALAAAIERLLRDRALGRVLGSRARASARARFAMDRMVGDTQALYEEVARRGVRARRPWHDLPATREHA